MNTIKALTATNWIAIAALAISIVSLVFSGLNYFRDRPRLQLKARRIASDEYPGYIEVTAINAGRRPLYLTMLWGEDKRKRGSGTYLDYKGPGIKLGENETKTFRITHLPRESNDYAPVVMNDDDFIDFASMWFEDSVGKLHCIPGVRPMLADLAADYSDWCKRTQYWAPKPPTSTPPSATPLDASPQPSQ